MTDPKRKNQISIPRLHSRSARTILSFSTRRNNTKPCHPHQHQHSHPHLQSLLSIVQHELPQMDSPAFNMTSPGYIRPPRSTPRRTSSPHHPLQSHLPIQLSNHFPLFQSNPNQPQWSTRPSLSARVCLSHHLLQHLLHLILILISSQLPPVVAALSCKYPTCTPPNRNHPAPP